MDLLPYKHKQNANLDFFISSGEFQVVYEGVDWVLVGVAPVGGQALPVHPLQQL